MPKKIVINKNLVPDSSWLDFRKVRAIVQNKDGEFLLTKQGGIYIFPGGKCDGNELEEVAIKREIKEETGIELDCETLEKVLLIEAYYDDFWDRRSMSFKPRHMLTTYFLIKTNKDIDTNNLSLTPTEINKGFDIFTTGKNNLYKLLKEDHSDILNGKFFDEENKIVLDEVILKKKH